jgi:HEAT repeat protein
MEEDKGLLKRILGSFSRQEELDDLLIMSEHRNGFKREQAVHRLGSLGNPAAIPKLLIRVNDWVPQVRSAAKEALEKLLRDENAQAFTYYLPVLYHLESCGRGDHNQLIANVIRLLLKPKNVAHITAAIKNNNPHIARIAIKICIDHAIIDKQSIVSECLNHRDVVVRSMASSLLRDLSGEALEFALQKAIQDPFMPIRREAFQIYLKALPENGMDIARQFLFDKQDSIREIAIAQLLKINTDVKGIFAHILSSLDQSALKIRCALLGMAHLDAKESISAVHGYTCYPLPTVRKASLQALAKLDGKNARSYLLAGLKDESPAVAKESRTLLAKLGLQPSIDELLNTINEANYPHTTPVCLASARLINKWDQLIFLLRLYQRLVSYDSSNAEILDSELVKWDIDFNRTSSQPTSAQEKQIKERYHQCRPLLSERTHRLLEFTVSVLKIDRQP